MITPAEIPPLFKDGRALGEEMVNVFSPESDGGKKVTKKELGSLAVKLGVFAARLLLAKVT